MVEDISGIESNWGRYYGICFEGTFLGARHVEEFLQAMNMSTNPQNIGERILKEGLKYIIWTDLLSALVVWLFDIRIGDLFLWVRPTSSLGE